MLATPIQNAITIRNAETLPNGVKVITVSIEDFYTSPHAIEYDGEVYGRTGWNSDKYIAYYRTDKKVGMKKNK